MVDSDVPSIDDLEGNGRALAQGYLSFAANIDAKYVCAGASRSEPRWFHCDA